MFARADFNSMKIIDCIISYRLDVLHSGVAKFNAELARRLDVPVYGVFDDIALSSQCPLFSLKLADMTQPDCARLAARIIEIQKGKRSRVFLHSFSGLEEERKILQMTEKVYCANSEIYQAVAALHREAEELWCPPLLSDTRKLPRRDLKIFSFGMAHKIRIDMFRKLHDLLEGTGQAYVLVMSNAFHESASLNDSLDAFANIEKLFGPNFYHVGFLSDAAVANFIKDATFFAAFFDKGVRANNSTVMSAMEQGAVVITNLDRYSPSSFIHMETLIDIGKCAALSVDADILSHISKQAKKTVRSFSWKKLLDVMQ